MSAQISGKTLFTGIIGYPIEHTLSPSFQNAAFNAVGLDWVYLPFAVAPKDLESAVLGLAACGCRGLNVTMPHKQAVMLIVDDLDESARLARAVNTIQLKGGRLIGYNTDGLGFIRSLKDETGYIPEGKAVLIAGAGGAARSVAVALAGAGASEIKILNRTRQKAEEIVGMIKSDFPMCRAVVGEIDDPAEVTGHDLIVNATSMGMEANPEGPLALDLLLPTQIVYDVVYWPSETRFLKAARRRGAKTVNGAKMLLYQGAEAFTIWTGLPAPLNRMAKALDAELRWSEESSAADKQPTGKNNIRSQTDNSGATQ